MRAKSPTSLLGIGFLLFSPLTITFHFTYVSLPKLLLFLFYFLKETLYLAPSLEVQGNEVDVSGLVCGTWWQRHMWASVCIIKRAVGAGSTVTGSYRCDPQASN